MARPIPLPLSLVVKNGSKICLRFSGETPPPVSPTAICTWGLEESSFGALKPLSAGTVSTCSGDNVSDFVRLLAEQVSVAGNDGERIVDFVDDARGQHAGRDGAIARGETVGEFIVHFAKRQQ